MSDDKSLGAAAGASEPALSPSATEPVPVSALSGDGQAQDLKPCPYCGGRAELREGEECAYVQCLDASYHRGPFVDGDNNASDEAIAAWNRRAPALSPKEAELVKPPREYEVSGVAVGGVEVAAAFATYELMEVIRNRLEDGSFHSVEQDIAQAFRRFAGAPRIPAASHDAARERAYRLAYAPLRSAQHALDIIGRSKSRAENGRDLAKLAREESERIDQAIASLDSPNAILAARPTTDGAGEPTAYRVDWWDGQRPRMRVQLSTVVEPWLHVLKPTFTPLYAATPPTTDASERMREAQQHAHDCASRYTDAGCNCTAIRNVDQHLTALAPSNNEVSDG